MGNGLPKSVHALGIHPGSTARGPIDCPVLLADTHIQGTWFDPVGSPAVRLGSMSSHLLRSAVSAGFPSVVLTPLLVTPPSLKLDSRSWAQCLAVDLHFCFHQLLDEGSRMAFKVVINLIIGEGHLR